MTKVAHIIRRRHARKHRKRSQSRRATFWLALIVGAPALVCLLPLIAALALAIWLYAQAASSFPSAEALSAFDPERSVTRFFDRSGETLIYTVQDPLGEERDPVTLEEIPGFVGDLTLAAENQGRAIKASSDPAQSLLQVWRYMLGVPVLKETGILDRLAQNVFLPKSRSSGLDDTLLELALSAESKRRYSADDLLELHLNTNYYGNEAFGIEAAARVYLGKSAAELDLADAALLAAIPPSPRQNPIDDERGARQRAADLLLEALNLGFIDRAAYDGASKASAGTTIEKINRLPEIAPEFSLYARRQAQIILDNLGYDGARLLARGGLRITTSLDLDLYLQSECLARAHLRQLRHGSSALGDQPSQDATCSAARELLPFAPVAAAPDKATTVILDVESGLILSMSGNAELATHQPGVVLQPFVYIEGFLRRLYTPATMVYDIPQVYPGGADGLIYSPANPDGRFQGPMNLRDAMSAALLPPAVQVANSRGMGQVIRTAHRLGFNSLDENRIKLDILERGGAVSVLDTGYAYSVLAAMGVMRGLPTEPVGAGYRGQDPVAVLRISDAEDKLLWQYAGSQARSNETPVIEPSLAYLVNDILADERSRQRILDRKDEALRVAGTAAVIDGLSADRRDSWTVGYSPQIVVAVNAAREDGTAMDLEHYDRAGSAPIWRALWDYATDRDDLPARDWPKPADIEEFLVCEISGQLPPATDHCPTRREIVPAGTSLHRDTLWQTVEINSLTGQLATVTTPENQRRAAVYFLPPDDIIDWWIADGRPLPPTSAFDVSEHSAEAPAVQLLQPSDFAYVGGLVRVAGRINEEGALHYALAYGAGVNPQEWIEIIGVSAPATSVDLNATWDTSELQGVYTLRLTALMDDGKALADTKQVTLDNTPPAVELRMSDGASEVKYPAQRVISLLADASDNLAIDRVEFYQDDKLLGIDRDWPYGLEYEIPGAGTLNFVALAFDQVGNSADSVFLATVEEG
ncbi:MAG: transglycosylase domain-containing protein [Chloroflexota bacterium]|nr:transglycosylase domain-containing protein [Chloroflexota bacterium]